MLMISTAFVAQDLGNTKLAFLLLGIVLTITFFLARHVKALRQNATNNLQTSHSKITQTTVSSLKPQAVAKAEKY
jgi:hypothetical protein